MRKLKVFWNRKMYEAGFSVMTLEENRETYQQKDYSARFSNQTIKQIAIWIIDRIESDNWQIFIRRYHQLSV